MTKLYKKINNLLKYIFNFTHAISIADSRNQIVNYKTGLKRYDAVYITKNILLKPVNSVHCVPLRLVATTAAV